MTAHKILLVGPLPPGAPALLARIGETQVLAEQADPAAFLQAHGSEFTVAVTNATTGISAERIAQLPRLQAVCSIGVGLETIDLVAARARGIVVSYTPDVLNDCVADLAIGLLIDVARGVSAGDRFVRRGDWAARKPQPPLSTRVSGKRLGLLGMGSIGRVIGRRGAGLDMDVRYHCRTPKPELAWQHEPSLLQLARWADFLVVACSGGPATRHLVSADVLRALGPKGFIVNIARGSVIDETALIETLQTGQLGGAGLDVFDDEPNVPKPLLALDNVVLQPHVGSATQETRRAMADLLLENVRSFVERGELVTPVRA